MGYTTTSAVPKLRFSEPVRNLPGHPAGRSREEKMTLRFAQTYRDLASTHNKTPILVRQIPVNGFGIADCIAVFWNHKKIRTTSAPLPVKVFIETAKPLIYAFEMKLLDWRKALMQANRYRFFAHVPVVVLPKENCMPALKFLETFRALGIGCWSFDERAGQITRHYTPKPTAPLDTRNAGHALRLVAQASKALPIS